jgi:hypothetical protein
MSVAPFPVNIAAIPIRRLSSCRPFSSSLVNKNNNDSEISYFQTRSEDHQNANNPVTKSCQEKIALALAHTRKIEEAGQTAVARNMVIDRVIEAARQGGKLRTETVAKDYWRKQMDYRLQKYLTYIND